MGVLRGEPEGWAPLLGTLKDKKRKALETGISLRRVPVGELEGGVSLPGTYRDG